MDEQAPEPDPHDVTTWEPRSSMDRAAVALHRGLGTHWRGLIVLLAALVLLAEFTVAFVVVTSDPLITLFVVLSALPAFVLTWAVYEADTVEEPVDAVAATFVLGALLASFAAVLNSTAGALLGAIPLVGMALFFFLIVGPGEELVKWAAVRLFAYHQPSFRAAIDGAVYGAAAGLGFAAIENLVYIARGAVQAAEAGGPVLAISFSTALVRSLAGPGHVLYTALSGYYLGLSRTVEPGRRGPVVVKGLLLAALLHASYNTLVTYGPALLALGPWSTLTLIVVFDVVVGLFLFGKLRRFQAWAHRTRGQRQPR